MGLISTSGLWGVKKPATPWYAKSVEFANDQLMLRVYVRIVTVFGSMLSGKIPMEVFDTHMEPSHTEFVDRAYDWCSKNGEMTLVAGEGAAALLCIGGPCHGMLSIGNGLDKVSLRQSEFYPSAVSKGQDILSGVLGNMYEEYLLWNLYSGNGAAVVQLYRHPSVPGNAVDYLFHRTLEEEVIPRGVPMYIPYVIGWGEK